MVQINFAEEPTPDEIESFVRRMSREGYLRWGNIGAKALEYDSEKESLTIHFEVFKQVFWEHGVFVEAEGFSPTEIEVLRAIEAGPDRMGFQEIKGSVNQNRDQDDELSESSIYYYLRGLKEKGLVDYSHNQYTYVGP